MPASEAGFIAANSRRDSSVSFLNAAALAYVVNRMALLALLDNITAASPEPTPPAMRNHASFMVKFCLAKTVECRRSADRATDPARRRSWLNTEGQWFFLARSYDNERRELAEPLTFLHRQGMRKP